MQSTHIPHTIVSLLPFSLYLYTLDGFFLCEFSPSGEVATVEHFRQLIAPPEPDRRRVKVHGHIPIAYGAAEENNAYLVPVVSYEFAISRHSVSGITCGLPDGIAADIVYVPRWYITTEDVARVACAHGRWDVITWDSSSLLFDEIGRKGICRFAQW